MALRLSADRWDGKGFTRRKDMTWSTKGRGGCTAEALKTTEGLKMHSAKCPVGPEVRSQGLQSLVSHHSEGILPSMICYRVEHKRSLAQTSQLAHGEVSHPGQGSACSLPDPGAQGKAVHCRGLLHMCTHHPTTRSPSRGGKSTGNPEGSHTLSSQRGRVHPQGAGDGGFPFRSTTHPGHT